MCTCKQKSKKPAGSPGNFNYVFTCTKDDGTKTEIKVTSGNDNEAKQLAELECQEKSIREFYNKELKRIPEQHKEVTIVAYVEKDEDYYFIYPEPCLQIFYKISKNDVTMFAKHSAINCDDGSLKPLFLICFKPSNVIEKTEIGSSFLVEDFLSENTFSKRTLNVKIDFKENGEGMLRFNGKSFPCLGNNTIKYPKDLTITIMDKYRRKYSNEYKVWMEYAILIWGQRGIYIHLGPDTIASNGGVSAGCIHVEDPQIVEFYNWITETTRIQISYPW